MPLLRPAFPGSTFVVVTAAACSSTPDVPPRPEATDVRSGQAVYENRLADGNSFACATCHALSEPAPDGLRRPGHPIGNATRRAHWKKGRAPTFLDAVNSCVTEWMVAPAWSATEPRFIALRDFLDAQATVDQAPDLAFDIVAPPSDISGGDAARGKATFDKTCIVCHGSDARGTDRAPSIAGSRRTPEYIARRVRTSGSVNSAVYAGLTGGVMPFWAADRLSDDELLDIIAWIHDSADAGAEGDASVADASPDDAADAPSVFPPPDGSAMPDATDTQDAPSTGCGKTNARVGWKADLGINTGEGQVSGFVTMIDDCTLQLTNFSYDGNGIDVRVYGSKNSSFRPGFIIGPDLVGQVFSNATYTVSLPPGKTLDDLDWVAIWCVSASADFGSGPFLHP